MPSSGARAVTVAGALALAAGCDPIVDVQGTFFPAWLVSMVVGLLGLALARWALDASELEPHLGPLIVVYPSLWLALTLASWLVLYRT